VELCTLADRVNAGGTAGVQVGSTVGRMLARAEWALAHRRHRHCLRVPL
jgi:hypothetical protein